MEKTDSGINIFINTPLQKEDERNCHPGNRLFEIEKSKSEHEYAMSKIMSFIESQRQKDIELDAWCENMERQCKQKDAQLENMKLQLEGCKAQIENLTEKVAQLSSIIAQAGSRSWQSEARDPANQLLKNSHGEKEAANQLPKSSNEVKESANQLFRNSHGEKEPANQLFKLSNGEKEEANQLPKFLNEVKESANQLFKLSNGEKEAANHFPKSSNEVNDSASQLPKFSSGEKEPANQLLKSSGGAMEPEEKGIISTLGDSVTITAGGYHNRDHPISFLRTRDKNCFANFHVISQIGESDGFILFDFGSSKIVLNSYLIRSNGEAPSSYAHPRTWRIEGSNNKSEWQLLDRRENDQSLNGKFYQNIFMCQYNSHGEKDGYRYIKYSQEENWLNDDRFNYRICLSRFELYGDVFTNN